MVGRARAWLEQVPIEDPIERRLAVTVQVLCFVAVTWGVLAIAVGAARDLLGEFLLPAAGIAFVFIPSLIAAVFLLRTGRYRAGLRLTLAGTCAPVVLLFTEGLNRGSSHILLIAVPLVMSALLLGPRAAWAVFATATAVLGVAALRDAGHLGGTGPLPRRPEPLGTLGFSLLTFFVLTLMLDRFGASLREALRRSLRRESERRASEERVRVVFATSPDAINLSRVEDGVYVEVNDGFTRLTGYTPQEAVGRTSGDLALWVDRPLRDALVERLARGDVVENVEAVFRRKDGSHVTALISSQVVTISGRRYLLSITRDITERKRGEEERAALQEQLRQAQKLEAIGRLAGGVAHDFNNILTSILASAELVKQELHAGHPARADAEQIHDDCRRAADLTRQLLAFARKQAVEPRVIRVEERAKSIEKMLRRVIGENIALETSYARDGWPVFVDPVQLDQVIMNLAVNARDAMPSGGHIRLTTENVRVREGTARQGQPPPDDYLLLTVADEGVGMPPQVLAHVFEPFYTTKGDRGTGLGLATCYGIVTQAGGTIQVDSTPGAGSRFRIYLPRAAAVVRSAGAEQPRDLYGSETVLVVEDDPGVRRLAVRSLSQLGYLVLDAGSAREAAEVAARQAGPIDCAVVDLSLPDGSGRDAVARALAGREGVPVLYVSGWGHAATEGETFLPKPYTPIDLARCVRTLLDGVRDPAAARSA